MQLRRVIKTLLAKWVIIVILAVAGTAIGAILASNHNDGIRPRWRAQAPVTFFQIEEDADSTSSSSSRNAAAATSSTVDAESERSRAGLLLEETLEGNQRLSILADRETNTLLFIAVGRDGEETLAEALALRDEYQALGATVLSVDQITATMETLLVDIDRLKQEITDLEISEPEPENPVITAQRTALETEIGKLDERQAQISIWITNPELRPTEDEFNGVDPEVIRAAEEEEGEEAEPPPIVTLEALQAEQTQNSLILSRLRRDLNSLPEPPVAETLDINDELELEALQLDLDELELQYVNLFRRLDGRPPGGFIEDPILTDETQSPRSVGVSAFLGFLAGSLVAGMAIIGYDQLRQPVWAASDLDGIISLGFVNRMRDDVTDDMIWYPTALTQRRRDIQTVRAATDAFTGENPAIIGFFGVGVAGEEVGELAADLAASYTVADREVLLIDGNSFHPNQLAEFAPGENQLNELLMDAVPADEALARINEYLDNATKSASGLTALHVDASSNDPIDVFAAPNCRILLELAKQRYDMVVVAGPEISDPLTDAVIHRMDIVTLVGYVGYTEKARIETVADAISDRKAALGGIVLLEGRRVPVREQIADYFRGENDDNPESADGDKESSDGDDKTLPKPTSTLKGADKQAANEKGQKDASSAKPKSDSGNKGKGSKDSAKGKNESVLDQAKAKRAESGTGKR